MHISVTKSLVLRHLGIIKTNKTNYYEHFKFTFTRTKQEKSTLCKLFKYKKNPME